MKAHWVRIILEPGVLNGIREGPSAFEMTHGRNNSFHTHTHTHTAHVKQQGTEHGLGRN